MRVVVGNSEIDVTPDMLPAFTYSIGEITEVDKIRGDRSTTMDLPATALNRQQFGGPSMAEDSGSRSQRFRVTDGAGGLYFDGTCVVTSRSEAGISLVALGGNAAWMQALKDAKLRQFDFGIETEVNAGTIVSSWTDGGIFYFPLLDYGALGQQAPGSNVANEQMRPGLRVARVLERVLASVGYGIEARGTFANLWPKIVTPNSFERIEPGPSTIGLQRAVFTAGPTTNGNGSAPIPSVVDEDPGSHYQAPGVYVPGIDATFSVRVIVSGTFTGNGIATATLRDYNAGVNLVTRTNSANLNLPWEMDFGDVEVTQGMELGVFIGVIGGGTYTINEYRIEFNALDIAYQDNITITPQGCAQDITAVELLRRVAVGMGGLVVYTRNYMVELWYYDEFFKDPSTGYIDLTGRVNGLTIKRTEEQPVAYEFKHERDSDDKTLETYGQDWADGRYEVDGGVMDEQVIDVGYTVTAMGNVLGGLLVPRMIDRRDSTVDVFEHSDRMLIADGVRPGSWQYNGEPKQEYPFAYSAAPGLTGVAFGDIERYDSRGNVSEFYRGRLRHATGPVLECDVYWHDHEVANFDPSVPVRVHDGQNALWCYVSEISQHRFGMGLPTRTKLIPR